MPEVGLIDSDVAHGKLSTYSNNLCRTCDACKAAWNTYQRAYSRQRRAEMKRLREEVAYLRSELSG